MPHTNKPKPIPFGSKDQLIAIAYANRPPTKKSPHWSWKMEIKSKQKKRIWIALGRLHIDDVFSAMVKAYQEYTPTPIDGTDDAIRSVGDLVEAWFTEYVAPRAPDGKLLPEYQLSFYTVRGYKSSCKILIAWGKKIPLRTLSKRDVDKLRLELQSKYAARNIYQILGRLKQILKWAKENEIINREVHVANHHPAHAKRHNNHHTPSHEDVAFMYRSLRKSGLKLGLYIAWKTGARIGEVGTLRWKDVYQDAHGCWIRFEGKTGSRNCPIDAESYNTIWRWHTETMKAEEMLFSQNFRHAGSAQLVKSCRSRGVEPFTFHGLRRLKCDTLQRKGIEPAVYEQIMGHSSRIALEMYRKPTPGDLQGAVTHVNADTIHMFRESMERMGITIEELLDLLGNTATGRQKSEK